MLKCFCKAVCGQTAKLKDKVHLAYNFQPIRYTRYSAEHLDPITDEEELNTPLRDDDPYRFNPIKAAENELTCSLNYDPLVQKFIRHIIHDGDKYTATQVVQKSFAYIKYIQLEKYHKAETAEEKASIPLNPHVIFNEAVENTKPLLILQNVRRGGVIYKVPVSLSPNFKIYHAFKWLIKSAKSKDDKIRIWESLAQEFIDASKNEGKSIRKKIDLHRTCEENKAYAHFR